MDECIINCLPKDLIERIFFRLPVSTLLRCIGVCKRWHNFIRDPQFVTSHLQHAPRYALLFFAQESVSGKPYPADAVLIDEAWSQSTRAVPVIGPDDFLFGSCNGLLSLYKKRSTIKIANLATGECLHLEKPVKNFRGDHFSFYSFGFHPVTKEYKITHFLGDCVEGRPHTRDRFSVIQVYSLGDEKWKDVRTPEALSLNCVKNSGVVNVDGITYWLTDDMVTNWQHVVMSFDLSEENFARIQLPATVLEDCACDGPRRYWIREIDGKVCIATAQISRYDVHSVLVGKLQIWTLDNKVEQRWIQKYSIQNSPHYIPGPHLVHGDKIMTQRRDSNLYSYELLGENVEIKSSNMVKLLDFSPRKPDSMHSYICVKSLVRLDVYKKAGIVREPKQRDGWELKKWKAWERDLCNVVEDMWSEIYIMEHEIYASTQRLSEMNQVLQHLPADVIEQRICMELNQLLQHMPDGPDQPRSFQRLNWVEQKRDMKKLAARSNKIKGCSNKIKDIKKAMTQAMDNFCNVVGSPMPDEGTSASTADNSSQ